MKKVLVSLLFIVFASLSYSQSIFDKFDGQEGITSIIVNKKMFELMSKVKMEASDKQAQQYLNLIKKLDNMKVFTTTSAKATAEMKLATEKHFKTGGLEELMRVNDGVKNVKISVKSASGNGQIKELLMFIEGSGKQNQTVVMSLLGDFNLDEISILTDRMKIPGGEDLKKATKK